jgi:hypothetical protein
MAYFSTEQKTIVVAALKTRLPDWKFRVSTNGSHRSTCKIKFVESAIEIHQGMKVNEYHLRDIEDAAIREAFLTVMECAKSAGWYDNSDIQVDHFDIAYYIEFDIQDVKFVPPALKKAKKLFA